jgi:hypothetical protein
MKRLLASGVIGLFLLGVSAAGAKAPQTVSSPATTCSPRVDRLNRSIAPTLRMVRASLTQGTCRSWIAIIGGGRDDIWGANYNNGLWHSSNELRTWRLLWQGPTGSHVERTLRTASGTVLIELVDAMGNRRIMRSTTPRARRFTTALVLPTGSFLHFTTSWGQYSVLGGKRRTVYVGEYGDHPDPVHLWASTNDGRSFRTIFTLRGRTSGATDRARHFHGVFVDPFTKWLWVAIGDNGPEPRIGYSRNGGRSLTWITRGIYPQSRAVALMFAKDAVYWGTDVPERPGGLYRWDRSTGEIAPVLQGLREPFFDARQSRGSFVQFSQISTKENDGYIGDEHVHVLVRSRSGWRHVSTPWTRNPVHKQRNVSAWGVTRPDAAGCFWMSLPYLVRSDSVENFKLCLGK